MNIILIVAVKHYTCEIIYDHYKQ